MRSRTGSPSKEMSNELVRKLPSQAFPESENDPLRDLGAGRHDLPAIGIGSKRSRLRGLRRRSFAHGLLRPTGIAMKKPTRIDYRRKSRNPRTDYERINWLGKMATGIEFRPRPEDRDAFVMLDDGDIREVIDELMERHA